MTVLRPITPADHADVLALNEEHVDLLAPMDADRLRELVAVADLAAVVRHGNAFAGFVLTMRSGSAYDSVNYRWFAERLPSFYYLDRIVLRDAVRRQGLGRAAYDEIEAHAATLAPVLALEVNLDPPNEPSLAFHRARGYREIGQQQAGAHLVSLLVKDL